MDNFKFVVEETYFKLQALLALRKMQGKDPKTGADFLKQNDWLNEEFKKDVVAVIKKGLPSFCLFTGKAISWEITFVSDRVYDMNTGIIQKIVAKDIVVEAITSAEKYTYYFLDGKIKTRHGGVVWDLLVELSKLKTTYNETKNVFDDLLREIEEYDQ